ALEEMNPARAEALLREAMRLNPQDRWHEVWLGKALAARGRHGEALETYRGVLRDHPDARETGQLVDETYRAMNDPAGRVAEWTRMTGAHPDSASCWLHLGKALEDAGNASAAAEAFGRARALNPKMEGLPAGDRTGAAP
ncbi:MAG TPA: tetratricopeptide repeat protein, partial [Candidatus Hydrogenedentes bacterium]|nr:tetratricopeptide repeat protein [Candidatus Hydrogenedentota bacterium]